MVHILAKVKRRLIVIIAIGIMVISLPSAAQGYEMGVCTHGYTNSYSLSMMAGALQELGATSFRDAISWEHVESVRGVYGIPKEYATTDTMLLHAPDRGLRPILNLDYGNSLYQADGLVTTDEARAGFANYVRWMVKRYKGRVHYYEIWNEWYLGSGSKSHPRKIASVADYVALLKVVYPVIKSVDPAAIVLGGGAGERRTEWFQEFARLGGLSYVDGVSIHPYVSGSPVGENTPEASLAWVAEVHRALSDISGKDEDIYITEVSWPAYDRGYAPDVVAVYLSRYLLLARARTYIKGVWWYDLYDDGPDETNREHRFGLLDRDHRAKPAFNALKTTSRVLAEARSVDEVDHGSWIEIKIVKADGQRLSATWAPTAIPGRQATLSNYIDGPDQRAAGYLEGALIPQEATESLRELGRHSPIPVIAIGP
jgi:hypothetical protein